MEPTTTCRACVHDTFGGLSKQEAFEHAAHAAEMDFALLPGTAEGWADVWAAVFETAVQWAARQYRDLGLTGGQARCDENIILDILELDGER